MNREVKFQYGFTNHAPVVFTLSEIQFGKVNEMMYADVGSVKYRRQLTGRQDRDRFEICEGDYLSGLDDTFRVFWNPYTASFDIEYQGGDNEPMVSGEWDESDFRIIGNVYDDPKLGETFENEWK